MLQAEKPAGCDSNWTSVRASFLTRPCQAHQYLLMRTLADEGEGQNLPPEAVRQLASAATRLSFPVPSAGGKLHIYLLLSVDTQQLVVVRKSTRNTWSNMHEVL